MRSVIAVGCLVLGLAACGSDDDSGSSSSTGGSSSGGSSASGGAATGGSAGSAGSATGGGGGAGGSSGGGTGGGTGGSGATGGGGTGGGGTGGAGTGGAPAGGAGGGGPSCTQLSTGKPGCDACAHASCCSQIDACFANPDCLGFLSCLSKNCASAGANLNACAQQFCSQYANGINAYNAVSQCIGQSCAGSC